MKLSHLFSNFPTSFEPVFNCVYLEIQSLALCIVYLSVWCKNILHPK